MQVATWNVNSVRTRLTHVRQWLEKHPDVDVLCLQETKVIDADFPTAPFSEMGYAVYPYGQKSYNGVALIARQPLTNITLGFTPVLGDSSDLDEQKRAIAAVANGIRIVNLYVPNGSAVGSDKYDYKLRWLERLRQYLEKLRQLEPEREILICGDFNVAIADIDIHDPKGREKEVMATDAERQALDAVLSLGFRDVLRKFTQEGGQFTWWDYRAASFRRNRGWRIDYHFITPVLYDRAIACEIDVEPRHWEQPSDHTPVIVSL